MYEVVRKQYKNLFAREAQRGRARTDIASHRDILKR